MWRSQPFPLPLATPGEKPGCALMSSPLSCLRGSWTTSCKIRTACCSSPHCTAAEGPSARALYRGEHNSQTSPWALLPGLPVPLAASFPALSLELPPGRERRPGAKNEPCSAREQGKAGGTWGMPSGMSGVEGTLQPGDPAVFCSLCFGLNAE